MLFVSFLLVQLIGQSQSQLAGCVGNAGTEYVANKVYGCKGSWTQPGIANGQPLCALGYSICKSNTQAMQLGLTLQQCVNATPQNTFYASFQSSPGNGVCSTVGNDDIFGCGREDPGSIYPWTSTTEVGSTVNCSPFNAVLGNGSQGQGWTCPTPCTGIEMESYFHQGNDGGVLCCKSACDAVSSALDFDYSDVLANASKRDNGFFSFNKQIRDGISQALPFTLDFDITLRYLGLGSYGNPVAQVPFTYYLGFDVYVPTRRINETNPCENRNATTYLGKSFSQFYDYLPTLNQTALNNKQYPQYGPAGGWSLSLTTDSDNCAQGIRFQRRFTVFELLTSCPKSNNENSFQFTDIDSLWLNVTGQFSLIMIAPNRLPGNHIFLTYPLATIPITFAFNRKVTVIGGVNDIYSFGFQPAGFFLNKNGPQTILIIYVLTWAARFTKLGANVRELTMPTNIAFIEGTPVVEENTDAYSPGNDCLFFDFARCYQAWRITFVVSSTCDQATEVLDMGGNYLLNLDVTCNNQNGLSHAQSCARLQNNLPLETSGSVTYRQAVLAKQFIDFQENCDTSITFVNIITGTMQFYTDALFTTLTDSNTTYEIGVSRVYVEVSVVVPALISVINATLEFAVICTHGTPNGQFSQSDINNITGTGGCQSGAATDRATLIDSDGIVASQDVAVNLHGKPNPRSARFSFRIPAITSSVLYVQTTMRLNVINPTTRRLQSMRVPLQTQQSTTYNHFIAGVANLIEPGNNNNDNNNPGNGNNELATEYIVLIAIAAAIVVVALMFVTYRMCHHRNEKVIGTRVSTSDQVGVTGKALTDDHHAMAYQQHLTRVSRTNDSHDGENDVIIVTNNHAVES